MQLIYLDNAATTALAEEVREEMLPWLGEQFGNPSSRHVLGVRAAEALDQARARVAQALGAREEQVVFTSGGTEANNLAILGLARAQRARGRHVLLGPTEHPAVRDAAAALRDEGFEIESASLRSDGSLDLEAAVEKLRPDTVLVAQMLVNNELGTIYPVGELARRVRADAPQAFVHVDAVQGIGKIATRIGELGAHSLAISGHKLHGPKGSGALVLAEGVRPRPLSFGGNQEAGLRSGTENVAGMVGLGRAVELAAARRADTAARLTRLDERFQARISPIEGVQPLLPAGAVPRSPAICALRLSGAPAEVWLHHLEARGVMTSVGSACQGQKGGVSASLGALGLSEQEARQVLRVSFSTHNREAEIDAACERLQAVADELATLAP